MTTTLRSWSCRRSGTRAAHASNLSLNGRADALTSANILGGTPLPPHPREPFQRRSGSHYRYHAGEGAVSAPRSSSLRETRRYVGRVLRHSYAYASPLGVVGSGSYDAPPRFPPESTFGLFENPLVNYLPLAICDALRALQRCVVHAQLPGNAAMLLAPTGVIIDRPVSVVCNHPQALVHSGRHLRPGVGRATDCSRSACQPDFVANTSTSLAPRL